MPGIIGFSTSLLPIRTVKNKIFIKWFEIEPSSDIVIETAENLVGKKRKEVWPELVDVAENIFLDIKKRDVFLYALLRYYGFFSFDPFLRYYPLRGQKVPLINSLGEMRVEVFSHRFNYGLEEKDEVLKQVLPPDVYEIIEKDLDLLWGDFEENKVFKRIGSRPSIKELTGLINFYYTVVLSRLLTSGDIKVFQGIPGSALKKIIYVSKTNGVYVETLRKDDEIHLSILPGNKELGSTSQQNSISRTMGTIIKELISSGINFEILFSVKIKDKSYKTFVFQCSSEELINNLVDVGVRTGFLETEVLDSLWEKEFLLKARKNRFNWEIKSDPFVIIEDDFVYVPDFVAVRGEKRVLIEIAGFFTEDYLAKKVEKLKKIEEKNKLIVVVPEKNKSVFEELKSPIITFKNKIPVQKVLVTLEQMFSEDRKERIASTGIENILFEGISSENILLLEDLFPLSKFNHEEEFSQWLKSKEKEFEEKHGYVVFPGLGLVKKELFEKTCKEVKKTYDNGIKRLEKYEEKVVSAGFPREWVNALLEKCGFEIVYLDFVNVIVRPKQDMRRK